GGGEKKWAWGGGPRLFGGVGQSLRCLRAREGVLRAAIRARQSSGLGPHPHRRHSPAPRIHAEVDRQPPPGETNGPATPTGRSFRHGPSFGSPRVGRKTRLRSSPLRRRRSVWGTAGLAR